MIHRRRAGLAVDTQSNVYSACTDFLGDANGNFILANSGNSTNWTFLP